MKNNTIKYEKIKKLFEDNKCILLTEKEHYVDGNTKVDYICPCGKQINKRINKFKLSLKFYGKVICRSCGRDTQLILEKMKKTCLEKYGKSNYTGSDEYKNKCLEKYGVEYIGQSQEIKNKIINSNLKKYGQPHSITEITKEKRKQYNLKKYGVEYYSKTTEYKEKLKNTLQEKYGFSNIGEFQNKYASSDSQKLFNELYKKLDIKLQEKCHYASLKGGEYCIKYQNKFFKYDFVNSITKTCIEYNGFNFHPRPNQLDEEVGWFAFDKNKTVKEARDYEKIKYQGLEERGYKILTVWDYEFKSNPTQLIQRCVDFITLGYQQ